MQRHGLIRLRKTLQAGDTLVVWRLDRIGYSMTGLLQFINELGYRDIASLGRLAIGQLIRWQLSKFFLA